VLRRRHISNIFIIFVVENTQTMIKHLIIIIFWSLSLSIFSQTMLLVEKPGTVKNAKYYAGDFISVKTVKGEKISGPINIIHDSSFVVDFTHELYLSDIEIVYKSRTLIQLLSSAIIVGSGLYVGLDLVNSGSAGKTFKENQSLHYALGVLAAGIGLKFFQKKKMRIQDEKWRIKILKP